MTANGLEWCGGNGWSRTLSGMARGRKIAATAGVAVVLIVASLLIPGSPTRAFASGVAHAECVTWAGHGGGPTLVAYGDSITQGDGQPQLGLQGGESWYSHLVCSGKYADGGNEGVAGQTSAQVLARLRADAPHADVIVVEAGTNDLKLGIPTSTTIGNLRAAVGIARGAAHVVVLTTVQPWTNTDANGLNAAVRSLAKETGARIADFAGTLSGTSTTVDGVHPTPQASQRLAQQVAEAATAAG